MTQTYRHHLARTFRPVLRQGSRAPGQQGHRLRTEHRIAELFARIDTLTGRRDRLAPAVDRLLDRDADPSGTPGQLPR